jgi:hypothetical protein
MKTRITQQAARWSRSMLTLALSASFVASPATIAQPAAAAEPKSDRKQQYAEAFAALDDAIRELPADTFDPQAVAEHVGREPGKLFEWVRDQTHYAPYAGALRGGSGVLMDRVGSSLDRALLLAELLRSAGYDVRLARGTLADPAKALAAVRPIPTNWRESVRPADAAASPELAAEQQAIAAADQALLQRTRQHADVLLKQLNGVARPAAATPPPADHWWVQFKQDEKWIDADPTLPDAKLGQRLTDPAETTAAPDDNGKLAGAADAQQHVVELKVVVERLENNKLTEASPLTLSVKPAALQGNRIVFTHVPVAWKLPASAPMAQRTKSLADSTEFVPVFYVGGNPNTNDAVTDTGAINEKPDLDRTAGMGKAAGGMVGGLGGALGGGEGAKADAGVWTAEWIEVTVRAPGKPVQTIRREVFDLIGPTARARGAMSVKVDPAVRLDRALALTGETDLLVLGSHASPEFVASRYAASLLKLKRQAIATLDKADAKPATAARSRTLGVDLRKVAPSPLWGVATARLASSPVAGDVYLDSPNVFALTRRARTKADGSLATLVRTDLAINGVAVRPGADAFAARVTQGVADTITEAEVARLVADTTIDAAAGAAVINTARLLEQGGSNDLAVNPSAQALSAWPDDARARAAQSAAAGFVLAAMPTPVGGQVGWWRVDPASGSTIGVTGDGYHAATTERQQMEAKINGLLDLPFNVTIEEAKAYGQKEFVRMICSGKGLSGVRLLQVFQRANQLYELLVLL